MAPSVSRGDPVPVSFQPSVPYELSGSEPAQSVVADFNGDTYPDIAVTCTADASEVSILLGDGAGGYFDNTTINPLIASWGIAAGDFDEDSLVDLAISDGHGAGTTVEIYLGDGDGGFTLHSTATAGQFPLAIVAADFNEDMHLDLAVANNVLHGVSILIGNGDGTFAAPQHIPGQSSLSATDLAIADFNNDNHADLAVSHYNGARIFLGAGDGTFIASASLGSTTTGAVAVGDVNNDNLDDVAFLEIYTELAWVAQGNGDGTFQAALAYAFGPSPEDLAVADLNQDGYADLIVAERDADRISVRLNDWQGLFLAPTYYGTGDQPVNLALGHWNQDTWWDVAVPYRNLGDTAYLSLFIQNPTSPCPQFAQQPTAVTAWEGESAQLSAVVTAGPPLSYQWQRNGVDLSDGPAPGGGTISGITTAKLVISDVGAADAGAYTLIATNPCDSITSIPATLTVNVPPPLPANWTTQNLHPAWALASRADAVSSDHQAGTARMPVDIYPNLEQPVVWQGSAASATNRVPGGSVGGAIAAMSGTIEVGWWWWPYSCNVGGQWQTCYSKQACAWTSGSHTNLQVSGLEFSTASDTDGVQHVGTAWNDLDDGGAIRAILWSGPAFNITFLHPAGVGKSGAVAVDGGRQFGYIHTSSPGIQVRAAKWNGTAASYEDLHPEGAARSSVHGAGDGQQVGMAEIGGTVHAGLWSGSALTFRDLHGNDVGSSEAFDCDGGLQVGQRAGHAVVWRGSADQYIDLHAFLSTDFTTSSARAIEVTEGGDLRVVGYGYNTSTGREEAVIWTPLTGNIPAISAWSVVTLLLLLLVGGTMVFDWSTRVRFPQE